jgi:SAM-dependent methyltransferase
MERGSRRALELGSGECPVRDTGWFVQGDMREFSWTTLDGWHPKADVKVDLNGGKLPFGDGEFDAVFARHVLEHVERKALLPLMREVARVTKDGGRFYLRVPWWNSEAFASDPTHVTAFSDGTLLQFCGGFPENQHYIPTLFACEELRFGFLRKWRLVPRPLLRELYHLWSGVCDELWATLRVTKDGSGGASPRRLFVIMARESDPRFMAP